MPARTTARWGAAIALLFTAAGTLLTPAKAHRAEPLMAPPAAAPPALVGTLTDAGALQLSRPALDRDALVRMADQRYGVLGSLDVTRALLAQSHGLSLPDLHPASRLGGGSDVSSGDVPPGVAVMIGSSGAGDLNGDGRDDVVLYDYDEAVDGTTIVAVNGADGSELWRRPPVEWDDGVAVPVADVTGDGRTDLFGLGLTVTARSTCPEEGPCNEWHQQFLWNYGVVSGSDGSDVWTQQLAGSFRRTETETSESDPGSLTVGWSVEYVDERINAYMGLAPSADHDADGASDIVMNVLSGVSRWYSKGQAELLVFQSNEWADTDRSTTHASVLSGVDGGTIATKSVVDSPSTGWLSTAPDLVGDDTPDFLWEASQRPQHSGRCTWTDLVVADVMYECDEEHGTFAYVVTAVDGATLVDAWSSSEEAWYGNAVLLPDVSGDGVADVFVTTFEGTRFLSGATGAVLWQTDEYVIHADGEAVITALTYAESGSPEDPYIVDLKRLDPSDGHLVRASTMTLDVDVEAPNYMFFRMQVADGKVAATLAQASIRDEQVHSQGSHVVIEDGQGGVLFDQHTDDLRHLWVFADVDGDGAADMLDERTVIRPDEEWGGLRWDYELVDIVRTDGTSIWAPPQQGWPHAGGNQDGAPGEEVLVTTWFEDGRIRTDSHAGPTGALRWSVTL